MLKIPGREFLLRHSRLRIHHCLCDSTGSILGLMELVLLQLWCRWQLQLRFDPWPRNFHILWYAQKKKKKKKEKRKKEKKISQRICTEKLPEPITSQRSHLQMLPHLGIRISTYELWADTNIQSIAPKNQLKKNENICSHKNINMNVRKIIQITPKWKQPTCLSVCEYMNKM